METPQTQNMTGVVEHGEHQRAWTWVLILAAVLVAGWLWAGWSMGWFPFTSVRTSQHGGLSAQDQALLKSMSSGGGKPQPVSPALAKSLSSGGTTSSAPQPLSAQDQALLNSMNAK